MVDPQKSKSKHQVFRLSPQEVPALLHVAKRSGLGHLGQSHKKQSALCNSPDSGCYAQVCLPVSHLESTGIGITGYQPYFRYWEIKTLQNQATQ